MKRTLSSSILKKKSVRAEGEGAENHQEDAVISPASDSDEVTRGAKPRLGGSGSAWKAGALSDAGQILKAERARIVDRILAGRHELRLDPSQIVDVIGTDRREDWLNQESFEKLKDSIIRNGQDTPIHVWPADPGWKPDEREPEQVDGVTFHLIVGRRRHAILRALGQPVRALLVPQSQRGSREEQFEMLFMRFRENEERENLSAFERLVSIGEMYERLQEASPDTKISASDFARRIGVHDSAVSRGRSVFAAREKILHACKNVFDLSHRDLEKVLGDLSKKSAKAVRRSPKKERKITVQRKVGSRKLRLSGQDGRLSIAANGLNLDHDVLEGLGDIIAEYLEKHGAK